MESRVNVCPGSCNAIWRTTSQGEPNPGDPYWCHPDKTRTKRRLAELDYLVGQRVGHDAQLALLDEITRGAYRLEAFTDEELAQARRIMERYADLRRQMRWSGGLIGDIDTLIAATALARRLTVVTRDSNFQRVPGLSVRVI